MRFNFNSPFLVKKTIVKTTDPDKNTSVGTGKIGGVVPGILNGLPDDFHKNTVLGINAFSFQR